MNVDVTATGLTPACATIDINLDLVLEEVEELIVSASPVSGGLTILDSSQAVNVQDTTGELKINLCLHFGGLCMASAIVIIDRDALPT